MPVENYDKSLFQRQIEELINKHSLENMSDTPDFILAEYLLNCLDNFNTAVKARSHWYLFEAGADKAEEDR